jgi:CHAD domain-containing protein
MPIDSKRSRAVFQKLEADLVKLSSKTPAQNVHRFRTGTRRLQILLGEFSPQLDRNQKKLLKMVGRIRRRAGKLRDLDVQLAALRSLKVAQEPRRKTQLVNHLIEMRARREKKLRKSVDAETVREVRKRLQQVRKNFKPDANRDALVVAKNLLKRMDAAAPVTEEWLHRYRVLTKRARYAAEFAGNSSEAHRFIAQLKRVQDALGDWHDWLTLTQSASENLGDLRESALVAELQNVTGAKFRHAISLLAQVREGLSAKLSPPPQAPAKAKGQAVAAASAA